MAGSVAIKIDKAQLKAVENMLSDVKNGSKKAMTKAINTTLSKTKTRIKKDLGKKLSLPAKRINQDLYVNKANYSDMSGSVQAIGKPVSLFEFGTTQTKKGAKARVYKANKKDLIPSSFHATMRSGHKGVFRRALRGGGKRVHRLPIEELTGPRIEDVLAKDEVLEPIESDASDMLAQELDKQAAEVLRRHKL